MFEQSLENEIIERIRDAHPLLKNPSVSIQRKILERHGLSVQIRFEKVDTGRMLWKCRKYLAAQVINLGAGGRVGLYIRNQLFMPYFCVFHEFKEYRED